MYPGPSQYLTNRVLAHRAWPPPTTKIYGNVSSRVIDGRHGGGGADSRVTMCKFRRRRSSHSCALSRHPFLARSFLDASFYWSTSTPSIDQIPSVGTGSFPSWLFLTPCHRRLFSGVAERRKYHVSHLFPKTSV